jgi:hypothetical protein
MKYSYTYLGRKKHQILYQKRKKETSIKEFHPNYKLSCHHKIVTTISNAKNNRIKSNYTIDIVKL